MQLPSDEANNDGQQTEDHVQDGEATGSQEQDLNIEDPGQIQEAVEESTDHQDQDTANIQQQSVESKDGDQAQGSNLEDPVEVPEPVEVAQTIEEAIETGDNVEEANLAEDSVVTQEPSQDLVEATTESPVPGEEAETESIDDVPLNIEAAAEDGADAIAAEYPETTGKGEQQQPQHDAQHLLQADTATQEGQPASHTTEDEPVQNAEYQDPVENPQYQEPVENPQQDQEHAHGQHFSQDDGLLPDWLLLLLHDQAVIDGDKLALVGIISLTLLALHLINSFVTRSAREQPLIRRLAELDRKLFSVTNELLILKNEQTEIQSSAADPAAEGAALREAELQLQQTWAELETSRATLRLEADRAARISGERDAARRETAAAQEEARLAQEMVEELIASQGAKTGAGAGGEEQLMEVVQQLQSQLESQKVVLGKYEPRLKKKEKENKELVNQIKQLRADVANANLEKEKMTKELTDTMRSVEESASKLNEVFKNEEEWKSLSDLLQNQLDEKSVAISEMETEMVSLRSRISVFKNEAESKEEQLEVLQETLDELQNRSNRSVTNNGDSGNGWDVEEEENGWDVDNIDDIKEMARLKVESKKNLEMKEALEKELFVLREKLETTSADMEKFKVESVSLRDARDEVVKDHTDLQRRMDVLTEFFNKKEAELQRQLGLQVDESPY